MRRSALLSLLGSLFALSACQPAPVISCERVEYLGNAYTICSAPSDADIRFFLNRENGKPLSSFEAVEARLSKSGARLIFAINGGMYHDDRRPVGLYVEDGHQHTPLNTAARDGNFGLVPNGVFYIADGRAHVAETNAYAATAPDIIHATQSGPMLVIDGALHPAFNADGTSKKRRNGVGISEDGQTVYFAITEQPVNFHSFASLFRDKLQTPNALFLDGTISRLYYPATSRNDPGLAMGPIIGVTAPK